MRYLLKWLGISAAILITVLFIVLVTTPLWQNRWILPVAGVRVEPTRPIVAEANLSEDSAFGRYRKAEHALSEIWSADSWAPGEKIKLRSGFGVEADRLFVRDWSIQEFPVMAETVGVADAVFEHLEAAIATPDPQVPTITAPDESFDVGGNSITLATLLEARAAAQTAAGNLDGAMDSLLAEIRLGDLMTRGGSLIHRLLAIGIGTRAMQRIRWITLQQELPASLSTRVQQELAGIELNLELWQETFRHEWLFAAGCIDAVYSKAYPQRPSYGRIPLIFLLGSTREKTRENLRYVFATIIRDPENPDTWQRLDKLMVDLSRSDPMKGMLTHRDPIGLLMLNLLLPVGTVVTESHPRYLATLRATQIILAMKAFEKSHGIMPPQLDSLVPAFLAKIPADPFGDGEMRYVVEEGGWKIYSVGPNRRDNGGRKPAGKRPRKREAADLVFDQNEFMEARESVGKPRKIIRRPIE